MSFEQTKHWNLYICSSPEEVTDWIAVQRRTMFGSSAPNIESINRESDGKWVVVYWKYMPD